MKLIKHNEHVWSVTYRVLEKGLIDFKQVFTVTLLHFGESIQVAV